MSALGAFALVLAFGSHTPLFALFFRAVPLASSFRYPEKYLLLSTLAAAYLAARGLTVMRANSQRAARLGAVVLAVVAILAMVAAAFGSALAHALVGRRLPIAPELAGLVLRDQALRALVVAVACWLPIYLTARGVWSGARAAKLFVLVVGVDLLIASTSLVSWSASQAYHEHSPLLDTEPLRSARGEPAPVRLYRSWELNLSGPHALAALHRASLLPNCGVEDGIAHLDAYAVFHTPAEADLWSVLRGQPLRLMQVTATHYAFLGDEQLGAGRPELLVRARYAELGASFVEVMGASPRVYLAERATVVPDSLAAAQAMAAPDFRPGHDAVIEAAEARSASGACTLSRFLPERIEVACESAAPAYLILADASFPGWRAEVNGVGAPVLRANAAMRGVPVPAGASRVVLRYRPSGLLAGAVCSFFAFFAALLVSWRSRRSDGPT